MSFVLTYFNDFLIYASVGVVEGTDRELMIGLANDQAKAFESLYLIYGRRLFVFINGYLNSKDDTDEIVQEVFVKIWQKRHELKAHESLKGYLFTIAYNAIKKSFLKKNREEELKKAYVLEYLNDSDDSISENMYSDVIKQVDAIVSQMPEKRKQVFNLCKREGLSVTEVANYLNISEKTVKNQMTSAYQTIREQLQNSLPLLLFLNLFY